MGLRPSTGKHQRGQQVRSSTLVPGTEGPRIVPSIYSLDGALGASSGPARWADALRRLRDQLFEHDEDLQGPLGLPPAVRRGPQLRPASDDCF